MRSIYALVVAMTLVVTSPVSGHHSNSIFNLESVVTIHGTVSRYEWRNPHVYMVIEARDDTGQRDEWLIEAGATPLMARNGWSSTTLTAGDLVTVRANPDRSANRHHAYLVSLMKTDGVLLTRRSGEPGSGAQATDISGVWDVLPGFEKRRVIYGALTAKGAAALAEYSVSDAPVSECIPYQPPGILLIPYLNEIEIRGDRVLISSEFFNVERTVYTDGRGHPENGERSNQGHSIGRWEGDVLVVDTTLFTDSRWGNLRGLPSGAQKRVEERYKLSEDRTQLVIQFTVEDPEYMVDPLTGGIEWHYAPDHKMLRFACDPENASRYKFE